MNKLKTLTAVATALTLATAAQAGVISYVLSGTFTRTYNNTSFGPTADLEGASFNLQFFVDDTETAVSQNNDNTAGAEVHTATFNSPFGQLTITDSPGNAVDGTYVVTAPTVTLNNSYGTNPDNDTFVFSGGVSGISDNIFTIQMTSDLGGTGVYSGSTVPSPALAVTGVVVSEVPPGSPVSGPGATDPSPGSPSFMLETFLFSSPDLAEYIPQNAALVPEVNSAPGLAVLALGLVLLARRRKAGQNAQTVAA